MHSMLARLGWLTRVVVMAITLGGTAIAMFLFLNTLARDKVDGWDILLTILFGLGFVWLAWSGAMAVAGLVLSPWVARYGRVDLARDKMLDAAAGRTVLTFPIYNEDPARVFGNLAAMYRALEERGVLHDFDFFVLSDSTRPERQIEERAILMRLIAGLNGHERIFYRHRSKNIGKKAGNVGEFVQRWGGCYHGMVVMDADSVMSAETLLSLTAALAADPKAGLIQTVPVLFGCQTLFGRMVQFASSLYGQGLAVGLALAFGDRSAYWGHNAIIRVSAFAACCGLPDLPGKPPFGGPILSHDFVEAAFLARGGWGVRLLPLIGGSYEEAPPNLISYSKRDRRWCQGNLQHIRIVGASGLPAMSRLMLGGGIMAYLASPLWLLFLLVGLTRAVVDSLRPHQYFTSERTLFPIWDISMDKSAVVLAIVVLMLLLLPRLLILVATMSGPRAAGFGGPMRVMLSAILETALSSVMAPVFMALQSRAVAQILLGRDSGWPAADRDDGSIAFIEAFKFSGWVSASALTAMILIKIQVPTIFLWSLPVLLPMLLAPVLVWMTAHAGFGQKLQQWGLLLTPAEITPEPVLTESALAREWLEAPTAGLDGVSPSDLTVLGVPA